MSFRKQEQTPKPQLSDQEYKIQVLAFENELGSRDFQQYAFDEGFIIKKEDYHDHFVVKEKIDQYNQAKQLNKDLEKLREQRYYMEKQEHERNIAPELICQPKTMKLDRCVYCYPWSFSEWCMVNGRQDLADRIAKVAQSMA